MQQIDSNEPASQLLAEEFADIMSKEDLQKMIELQTQMYVVYCVYVFNLIQI